MWLSDFFTLCRRRRWPHHNSIIPSTESEYTLTLTVPAGPPPTLYVCMTHVHSEQSSEQRFIDVTQLTLDQLNHLRSSKTTLLCPLEVSGFPLGISLPKVPLLAMRPFTILWEVVDVPMGDVEVMHSGEAIEVGIEQ